VPLYLASQLSSSHDPTIFGSWRPGSSCYQGNRLPRTGSPSVRPPDHSGLFLAVGTQGGMAGNP